MTENTTVLRTLALNVPKDTQTVTVHLQIEVQCTCASKLSQRPGSYTDTQPSKGQGANDTAQGGNGKLS
jgi:hypothetical protein